MQEIISSDKVSHIYTKHNVIPLLINRLKFITFLAFLIQKYYCYLPIITKLLIFQWMNSSENTSIRIRFLLIYACKYVMNCKGRHLA